MSGIADINQDMYKAQDMNFDYGGGRPTYPEKQGTIKNYLISGPSSIAASAAQTPP